MEKSEQHLLTTEQLESILRTLVAEIRKPPVDPIKEIQKSREKETKEKTQKEYWARRLSRLQRCSHSRQDGTCCIGWATQSDNIERGYCPNCDNLFSPELAQFGPEFLELYQTQRRRPRGLMESVRYVS